MDIFDRLHSIHADSAFVNIVHDNYKDVPIVANLRCGEWYTNPSIVHPAPQAYFKSTDGHYGNWMFNLRRPNLHLLPLTIQNNALIIVDSTRAGKRIPDALSKSVPIWCAVINRALILRFSKPVHPFQHDSNACLHTPPDVVSPQEHHQIELRIDAWAEALANSSYQLPELCVPLRPLWITPANRLLPPLPHHPISFIPVICVSASPTAAEFTYSEATSNHPFTYIQGSGDDHELWGMGLTPSLYWTHQARLLSASREDLPAIVQGVISDVAVKIIPSSLPSLSLSTIPDKQLVSKPKPSIIPQTGGRIMLCELGELPQWVRAHLFEQVTHIPKRDNAQSEEQDDPIQDIAYIVLLPPELRKSQVQRENQKEGEAPESGSQSRENSSILALLLPFGKKGHAYLVSETFPEAVRFARAILFGQDENNGGNNQHRCICVACDSGSDANVGVALVLLQTFFGDLDHTDDVKLTSPQTNPTITASTVSKKTLKTRLEWIIGSRPGSNPARGTLQRVNEYFMSRERVGKMC